MNSVDLNPYGITVKDIQHNLQPAALYVEAIQRDDKAAISNTGALLAFSGEKTGRSPKDKRVVKTPNSEADVWWGNINIPMAPEHYLINRERAIDYFNICDRLYIVDGYAGWDESQRVKIRIICTRPYHALFMHTMLIRPTQEEHAKFGKPDALILNAGKFPANSKSTGMTSKTCVSVDLDACEMVILGTEYAGEMKKGVFTMMNYYMPKKGVLSMHCSATADRETGSSSVLFGLSGTGKTTLSADPKRNLIGDDEHCWTDTGIYNIEGGCYAKAIDLSAQSEPDIFQALRYGSVLENVVYNQFDHAVDYSDTSITENTRGAYPIEHISNAQIPCVAGHPTDVIFLTCDAFGVLPPVSRLTLEQAMYHFISGYTAKVAGTEMGVTEPQATFSPCFGGPFLVWHPGKYAELLADRLNKHKANVWLVNTGWSGGAYGVGKRMKLGYTRSIIDAIHGGKLADAPTEADAIFGVQVVTKCPDVPEEILVPRNTWKDKGEFATTAKKLAGLFVENFEKYADGVSDAVRAAGPKW